MASSDGSGFNAAACIGVMQFLFDQRPVIGANRIECVSAMSRLRKIGWA
ncbi:hypothetical protein [Novipirellula maiorica]|nr:hypothetical protein [Rhodopirellula maiorica]